MRKTIPSLVLTWMALCSSVMAQEPRVFLPHTFQDPDGWFSIQVPSNWEEKSEAGLGRKTFCFLPEADSEDAGKMDMSVTFIMGWRLRQVTEEILQTASAEALDRLRAEAAREESAVVVRETKTVFLARQSALLHTIDETRKDGKQAVIRMFVAPSFVHTYVIEYRLPLEDDELLSLQFDRMVKTFSLLTPQLEAIDLEGLDEYSDKAMKVSVKYPTSWKPKAVGEGNERRIAIVSPESREPVKDPCPAVMIQKIAKAAAPFEGEELTPEGIIVKYRDLYLRQMEKSCGKITLDPESSIARIGSDAALAYKLEFISGDQSRYALLVIGIQEGTIVRVFLVAPAEEFHHYAPLFGRMLSAMSAF